MKKQLQLLFVLASILAIASTKISAQVNIALTGVATHGTGGVTAFGPQNYNDQVIAVYNNQPWGWINTGQWIEYTWSTPQIINRVLFHKDNRPYTTMDIQYWDGSTYVNAVAGHIGTGLNAIDSITFTTPIVSTRLRFNNIQGSNPNFREIQVYQLSVGYNNAGTALITSPTNFVAGNQQVKARIKNEGKNQILVTAVGWSVNGVAQTPISSTTTLDTIGGAGSYDTEVTLGTYTFLTNILYDIKVWTSMPNNVVDTIPSNDTATKSIRSPLNGTYTVGASGDFITIAQAISTLSSSGVNGPVTFTLIDNLYSTATGETFPYTIGAYTGMSASNPVTFMPSATSTPYIVGNSSGYLLNLNGAKYVTIDGRQSPTDVNRNITIENTNTGISAGVIHYLNDATQHTIRNCVLRGSGLNTTTGTGAQGLLRIGSTNKAIPMGNDSITVFNNTFARSNGLVYSHGLVVDGLSATAQNDVINIDSNWFQGFGMNGVFVTGSPYGNGSYFNIRGNSFYDTAQTVGRTITTAITAINFVPAPNAGSNFNVIDGNYIGGKSEFAGGIVATPGTPKWEFSATRTTGTFTGILTSAGTQSGVVVTRNVIRNIWSYSTGSYTFYGISHTGGTATIGGSAGMGNMVGAEGDTSILHYSTSTVNGIRVVTTNDHTITHNTVAGLISYNNTGSTTMVLHGIFSGSSSGNVSITNNTVRGLRTLSNSTGTTTTAALVGIAATSSSNAQIISNNTVGGINPTDSLMAERVGGARVIGILASAGTNTISNNSVQGMVNFGNVLGTTTGANMVGIMQSSGSNGHNVSNNTVSGLWLPTTATTSMYGIISASGANSITSNTVSNLFAASTNTNSTSSAAIIGIGGVASSLHTISNNTINNIINTGIATSQIHGILYIGSNGSTINNNTITSLINRGYNTTGAVNGIYNASSNLNQVMEGNTIHSLSSTDTANTPVINGIYAQFSTTIIGNNSRVVRNNIHSFGLANHTTQGAATINGINFASGSCLIANNNIRLGVDSTGISLLRSANVRGIYQSAGGVLVARVYHNNVFINTNPATGTTTSAAYDFASSISTGGLLDIRNNIFANISTNAGTATGNHFAARYAITTNMSSDFNIYHIGSALTSFVSSRSGINSATLGAHKNNNLLDGSSAQVDPQFVAPNGTYATVDLSLAASNPAEKMGDTIPATFVTDDIAGNLRNARTPHDIGSSSSATATTMADSLAPAITYTALTNTASPLDRSFTATLYDASGMGSGANLPVVVYRKGANAWQTAQGVLQSGTMQNGVWMFTISSTAMGGLTTNDVVSYYIAAQDVSGNINANPMHVVGTVGAIVTHPVTPRTYTVTDPIPTTVTIGASGTYTSLTGPTGAFSAINNSVVQGNTEILIMDNSVTEDGTVQLNPWIESGAGGYTITIRPQNNTQKVLVGTLVNTNGLIRLNGTSRVNILGYSPTGNVADSNLIIRSQSTSTPALSFLNGGGLDTMIGVIFESRTTSNGVVWVSPTTTTVGVSNVVFSGCTFRSDLTGATRPGTLFLATGTTPRLNSNISFNNCEFYNFNTAGINIGTGNGDGFNITNNHFYYNNGGTHASTITAISVTPAATSNGNNISNNWIGGNGRNTSGGMWLTSGGFTGISVSTGLAAGTTINNNVVSNINLTTSTLNAITVFGNSANYVVNNNRVGHMQPELSITSSASARITAINSTTTGNITINGDSVLNMISTSTGTAAGITGINVSSGSSNVTNITNNYVYGLKAVATNTGTTTATAIQGIMLSSTSSFQTVSNNTVRTLVNPNTTVAHGILGITCAGGINTVSNNLIYGIQSGTTRTTTNATTIPMCGLMMSTTSSGTQNVSGNTIDSMWYYSPTPASTQMIGIYHAGSSASIANYNNNTVRNLSSVSSNVGTLSAAAMIGMFINNSGSNQIVDGNTVHTLQHWNNTSSTVMGIYYVGTTTLAGNLSSVSRNFVHSLRTSSATASPILVGIYNSSFATFANNRIRLGIDSSGALYTTPAFIRGIWHNTTTQSNFYHNSIYIGGAPASGSLNTSALEFASTITAAQQANVRNNILVNMVNNNGSFGKNWALKINDTLRVVSNYNLFYAPNANSFSVGRTAYDYPSLTIWRAFSGQDLNSAHGDPMFNTNVTADANAINMDMQSTTPIEKSGDPDVAALITNDFYGTARNTNSPTDIGAHGGNFNQLPDIFAPSITFTPLGNSGSLSGTRELNGVVIKDNNGIPMTGANRPKIYYTKDTTWYSTSATSVTGTATNAIANFSIDYTPMLPLTTNDTIKYFVLVGDNAGNFISNNSFAYASHIDTVLANPINPNRYTFLPVLAANSVYQVGSGQTYPTLTGAGGLFEFLNSRTLGGNITAEITSDITEPGTIALNPMAEDGAGSGTYTVTIRPNAATTAVRTLSGNAGTNGLIVLNGADRVKITGVPTGGNASSKFLRFRNNSTGGSTISLLNGVSGTRLHNLLLEGAGTATTSATVALRVTAGALGNTFDTISNCVFSNNTSIALPGGIPNTHIFSDALAATNTFNSDIVVSGNEVANFGQYGIYPSTYNTTGWQIIDNSLYNNLPFSPATTYYGIYFTATTYMHSAVIKGNYIGGSAPNCGGTAWTNNQASSGFNGLYGGFGNGPASLIQNNTVNNINFTASGGTGQFIGIYVYNGSAVIGGSSTTGNTVGNPATTNGVNWAPNSTHYGIYFAGNGTCEISHNTVAGMNMCSQGASGTFYAYYLGNGNIISVNNNTAGNIAVPNSLTLNSNGTLFGIYATIPSNLTSIYPIANNNIHNLYASSNLSGVNVRGINIVSSANVNLTNNVVSNITTNSSSTTSTTAAAIGILSQLNATSIANIMGNTVSAVRTLNISTPTTSMGICLAGGQTPVVDGNRIFDITNTSTSTSTNPAPAASGIAIVSGSVSAVVENNQITLGNGTSANTQYNGIWLQFSSTTFSLNAYNNSVLIAGTASGSNNSFAFVRGNNTGSEMLTYMNLRNNIFANNRTGGTGKHYAIANQTNSPSSTYWYNGTSNHNLLVSASISTLGLWGSVDANYANWIASSSSDELSYTMQAGTGVGQLNLANLFTSTTSGNLNTVAANTEAWYVFGKGIAGALAGNNATDFNGNVRGTTAGMPITIGSTQINAAPSALPPAAVASATPSANTTTIYTFAGRNVLSLAWQSSAPTNATVYYMSGFSPIGTVPSGNNTSQYVRVDVSGGTAPYGYNATLNYDPATMGSVSSAANLKISKENGGTLTAPTWATQVSNTVNQTARTVTATGLTSTTGFSALLFTGTENAAPPVVTAFTPNAREIGGSVTIRGTLFTGASAVSFNGTSQPTFTVVNDTTITTTVPTGTTTGTVSVTNPFGTGTSTAVFTVIPAPTVSSFSPTSGTLGSTITITGTGFTWATAVQVGGINAPVFTIVNNTTITATIPAAAVTGVISVINPSGTGSSVGSFTVIPAPTVSTLNPTTGPVGTTVTITGTNFQAITAVQFNGAASSYTVNSSTQITATVPSGASTGLVSVINGSGTANSAGNFTVTTPPVINSFSPTAGGIGSTVVITGTNFTGATAVTFNNVPATVFTVNSSTQITATVPGGASTGVIGVTTPQGTIASSGSFTVYVDLVVTSGQNVSGIYNNIIITSTGFATLTGALTALGNTTNGGILALDTFVLSGNGTFTNQPGATLKVAAPVGITATGGVSGGIQVNGVRTYMGTIEYNGTVLQNTGNALANADSVMISNVNGVNLTAEGNINFLSLAAGKIFLGNNNLTVNNGFGAVTSNNYVAINDNATIAGSLKCPVQSGGAAVLFPIGSATLAGSYTPATITMPTGTTDVFSVRVFKGVYSNGTSGALQASNAVNRSWVISENVAGGSNATVQVQWDDTMELASFNRAASAMPYYASSTWNWPTGFVSSFGTGPFVHIRSGVNAFGIFTVADALSALPVQLLSFEATRVNNDVKLNWLTASEKNNSHFVLERAEDGINFTPIHQVAGKGNTNQITAYAHTDKDVFTQTTAPVIFYRLKQVDKNGKYTYHNVVSVENNRASVELQLNVFPNPFGKNLTADVVTNQGGNMQVDVFDMQGRKVSSEIITVEPGNSSVQLLKNTELTAGVYFMEVLLNNNLQRIKLVKQAN